MNLIYQKIESKLSLLLQLNNFELLEKRFDEKDFGSIYTTWKNNSTFISIRLIYDGKENLFAIEKSFSTDNKTPNSWSNIAILKTPSIKDENIESLTNSFINKIKPD